MHLACPIVCDPESATNSLAEKPLPEKALIRPVRFKAGEGMFVLAALKLAVSESLLPTATVQLGPPNATVPSRAATDRISAQETTPGHAVSKVDLMESMTSNPLRELLFGPAVFSPVKVELSSKRTDASHPLTKQSWKWRRSKEAPIRASLDTALVTADLMVVSALEHDDA